MIIRITVFLVFSLIQISCQRHEAETIWGKWHSLPNATGTVDVIEFVQDGHMKFHRFRKEPIGRSSDFEYQLIGNDSLRISQKSFSGEVAFGIKGDVLSLRGKMPVFANGLRQYFRPGSDAYQDALDSLAAIPKPIPRNVPPNFFSATSQWPAEAWEVSEKWQPFVWDILKKWEPGQWKASTAPNFPWKETPNWNANQWENVEPVK